MRKFASALLWVMGVSLLLPTSPATASELLEQERITVCTSIRSGFQMISKTGKCNERIYEARTWYKKGAAPSGTPGSIMLELRSCISKKSAIQIIRMRADCNPRIHRTALWQRPLGPPLAPSINSVVMGVLGSATLNITAPIEDGGSKITSYLLTSTPGQIKATYTPAQIKEAKVIGLSPGSTYSFSVVAINERGPSVSSIASSPALAPTTPGAPSITKVTTTGTNSAQLSFTAPLDDGGSPITSYVATSSPGGLKTTLNQSTGGTINITNLSHSTTYTFTLTANNAAGPSLASETSTSITTETPPPPPPPEPVAEAPSAPTNTVISVAAIAGVTAPVTGATPVTSITETAQYTGAVSWSGSPATFAGATTYTATITLTAKSGFTLTGVSENFFTVAGATTVTNSANSGVITAVFPATTAYIVGDTGPGGGTIFYVDTTPFACGPTRAATCTYLEAAPSGWNTGSDPTRIWANRGNEATTVNNNTSPETATATAIGWGYRNTRAIILQGNTDTATIAAALADSYTVTVSGVLYDDWFLPSKDELNQMCKWAKGITGEPLNNLNTECSGGTLNSGSGAIGFEDNYYWSSSEGGANTAWEQRLGDGVQFNVTKWFGIYVRPVRAFGTPPPIVSIAAITGVTAPVTGATPVTTITESDQYTGTVTWASSGGALDGNFLSETIYTATITLTAKSGFTLTGVGTDFFTVAGTTSDTNTASSGVVTAVFPATAYMVGDRGPGGGIVYYVSAEYFTSAGSTCDTTCKYLEVAPAGWNNGGVVTIDPELVWSTNITMTTGQDTVTAGTESGFVNEKFNWKIGQGFYNTSVMKVAGATSTAQAAVLAYAGTSVAGQWFIPSMNELNELCKYALGQTTGVLTVACDNTGTLKTGTASDLGGFMDSGYGSSSEDGASIAWTQDFDGGYQGSANKNDISYVRPVRAF